MDGGSSRPRLAFPHPSPLVRRSQQGRAPVRQLPQGPGDRNEARADFALGHVPGGSVKRKTLRHEDGIEESRRRKPWRRRINMLDMLEPQRPERTQSPATLLQHLPPHRLLDGLTRLQTPPWRDVAIAIARPHHNDGPAPQHHGPRGPDQGHRQGSIRDVGPRHHWCVDIVPPPLGDGRQVGQRRGEGLGLSYDRNRQGQRRIQKAQRPAAKTQS